VAGGRRNVDANFALKLRDQIPQLMKAHVIPGAAVLVMTRDEGDWSATFGTREIGKEVPLSTDDYFRVGSNTKTMTGTVILQLVQEGRLELDDAVSAFWPGVPNGDRITIAQLCEMRSGLYSYTFDRDFNETLDREPQKAWNPEELLAIGFSHPTNFEPGERFDYCNTNTVLLGVIIEKLTEMSASDAFKERIFEPLGLKHTSLPDATDSSIPDPHPQGYAFGTNVSTIDTPALPPADRAAALAGTLKPNNETNANPSWVIHGWRCDLHGRRPGHLREGVGRRRSPRREHAEAPYRQHPANRPGQSARRRLWAGDRPVRSLCDGPRRTAAGVHDLHGSRPSCGEHHRRGDEPGGGA